MKHWKDLLVGGDDTIGHVLNCIDSHSMGFALVVDDAGRLHGVVTDGNVRRGFIGNQTIGDPVSAIMESKPFTVSPSMQADTALSIMVEQGYNFLPVVDVEQVLIGLWTLQELISKTALDIPVVLMAGGMGSRLGKLTQDCPKPLLKIGEKPLLEISLRSCLDSGFRNFFIAVNYQSEKIEKHFGDGTDYGVSIQYLREKKRLGTVGALSLLPKDLDQPVIVLNGDVLTKINLRLPLQQHIMSESAATMVVRQYSMMVPYGVIQIDADNTVLEIAEKPTISQTISAGINVFSCDSLCHIPSDTFFDVPDLIKCILSKNKKITTYTYNDYWIDIGRVEDYNRAIIEYNGV